AEIRRSPRGQTVRADQTEQRRPGPRENGQTPEAADTLSPTTSRSRHEHPRRGDLQIPGQASNDQGRGGVSGSHPANFYIFHGPNSTQRIEGFHSRRRHPPRKLLGDGGQSIFD